MDFKYLGESELQQIDDCSVIYQLWIIEDVGYLHGYVDSVEELSDDFLEDVLYRLEEVGLKNLADKIIELSVNNKQGSIDFVDEICVKCYHSIQDKC